ncbi:MAG TPA: hypothetical protein VFL47_09000, partial [Flavisolibacter sp.]|nr:hypothetical protein [Flavisolibacter sp.]
MRLQHQKQGNLKTTIPKARLPVTGLPVRQQDFAEEYREGGFPNDSPKQLFWFKNKDKGRLRTCLKKFCHHLSMGRSPGSLMGRSV